MQSVYFHKVEDAVIILVSKGTFKQTEVYSRKGYLYAKPMPAAELTAWLAQRRRLHLIA